MDFRYSEEIHPSLYETHGLSGGVPLRMHKDPFKEIHGALRAQRDWTKHVHPVHGYKGGLGKRFSFIRVTVPECLPDRLEIISYANEYAFLYDDEMENLDLKNYSDASPGIIETFGDSVLDRKVDSSARPEKRLQAKILSEMMSIDPERAVTSMKAWAAFVQLAARTRTFPFETLDDYIPARVIDAGELIWFGTLTFGMALTIPEEEYKLCMELARPGYAVLGLTNDLYSWDKERAAAERAGQDYVFNAVWVIMRERCVDEETAKTLCAEEIKKYLAVYRRVVEEVRHNPNLSRDLRAYIDAGHIQFRRMALLAARGIVNARPTIRSSRTHEKSKVMGAQWSQVFPPKPVFTEANVGSQEGKVFLITGGSSGIGFELAKILYRKHARVYIGGRSEEKARKAIQDIQAAVPSGGGALDFLLLELDDLSSIKASVEAFKAKESKLHVLWNNAGVSQPPAGSVSKQGIELQLATNCLGPFLLTQLLLPLLEAASAEAPQTEPGSVRVVWLSSQVIELSAPRHGFVMDEIRNPPRDKTKAYTNSKTGNLFLSSELARRVGPSHGIVSVALNPGAAKTNLFRHTPLLPYLAWPLLHKPELAALTELYAGLSKDITLEQNGISKHLREDLLEATKVEEDGGFCEEKTRDYL
ncbi:hypothetical protein QBC46DRAFT_462691 [Diplogelasinospora grovesii]|uniref:Uncharacterized protein n=1 Tax=Diplogelasinospora grovesii TaxID=303347 RepID=A0AAN6MYP2_9PEZI|nr:hypothetical protein QBC46DRAFT_462691 [Diplogelasinospora grovesii]